MRWLLPFLLSAMPALADSVLAARTIRPQEIIAATDLVLQPRKVTGAHTEIGDVVGQEARVAIYAGRPVRSGDVGPPAVVARNQMILIVFSRAGLRITSEGRSLSRGGVGDRIRVMNLASRTSLYGTVLADGTVTVTE